MGEKYVRCRTQSGEAIYGKVAGTKIERLTSAPWLGGRPTIESFEESAVHLLAPVEPSKIVCIGLNYHAHVSASFSADKPPEYPLIFLKPPSSIIAAHDKIVHPPQSERVDYEAELGVVIGTTARNVSQEEAERYIFGFTCVNDVT